ncbi:hypothetical protein FRB95_004080 [Tulasnella sp. JGI-2019a]|nr:hypothetical protein FRB95_004080 [Tulasnella sp. JGI-2019a]
MVIPMHTPPEDPVKIWEAIGKLLLLNVDALGPPLRRDFLHIVDYLRTIGTPQSRDLLGWWRHLGALAGLSEEILRDEVARERNAARRGLVGCSWLKCALYEQETTEEMFFCVGCSKAMYCGQSYQDRDWKEDDHRTKCKR